MRLTLTLALTLTLNLTLTLTLTLQAAELMQEMDLVQFKDRWVHVEACSAKTGEGLEQGMAKLMEQKAARGA